MHDLIDSEIKNWLDTRAYESEIFNALEYALFSGGKRFRPQLCLLTSDLLDNKNFKVLPFSVAIELIHTFSLIHDDLPCMDNDDLRRNKPSLHKKFGQATALLTGDLLLTEAMLLLSSNYDQHVIELVLQSVNNMIDGQLLDINSDEKKIEVIYELKTGKLIQCSVLGVCAICNANKSDTEGLKKISKNLGLAFQIYDDIMDFNSGKDNINYVSINGFEFARKKLKSLLESLEKNLDSFSKKQTMLSMVNKHFKGFYD